MPDIPPIDLTQLRADVQQAQNAIQPKGQYLAGYTLGPTTLLALIDTAEAAQALALRYTLTGGGALEMLALVETLARYTPTSPPGPTSTPPTNTKS